MADKDGRQDDGSRSLELPSFGFGRRRKRTVSEQPEAAETTPAPAAPEPVPEREPAPEPPIQPTGPVESVESVESVQGVPEPDPAPRSLFADELAAAPPPAPTRTDLNGVPEAPPRRSLPAVGGTVAALIVGLVVGALTVALTWAGLQGCEAVRGTSSCGNPGFLLLLAILVAMVVLGSALLRLLGVEEPGSTSFLGVGLLAVVALLFLVDVIFSWTMIVVLPLVTMATFALSRWVTTAFTDES